VHKKTNKYFAYIIQTMILLFVTLITAPPQTAMATSWADLVKHRIYMENPRTLNGKAFLNLPIVDATVLIYDQSGTLISSADLRTSNDGSFSRTQPLPESFSVTITDGWLNRKPFDHDVRCYINNFKEDDSYSISAVTTIIAEYQDRHPELSYTEIEVIVEHYLSFCTGDVDDVIMEKAQDFGGLSQLIAAICDELESGTDTICIPLLESSCNEDSDWGKPYSFKKPTVHNTQQFEFLVCGDPQPDLNTYLGDDDEWKNKLYRTGYLIKTMNSHIDGHKQDCVGVVAVGDLTEHGCAQEIIAFRRNFEHDYPGHHGGCVASEGKDGGYMRGGKHGPLKKPVYPLIGNHSDMSRDNCDSACDCNDMNDDKCYTTYTQNYIRKRVQNALYDPPTIFNRQLLGGSYYHSRTGDIYAYEWGSYHFIVADLWMGYAGWNDRHKTNWDKMRWLKNYLENAIGDSGKPVLLFQHYGWDSLSKHDDWWNDAERKDLTDLLCRKGTLYPDATYCNPYNVLGIFTGHRHQEKHITISAGQDKDGNEVAFDNYVVDDSGPVDFDNKTGFYIVKLGLNGDGESAAMEIGRKTHSWNKARTNFDSSYEAGTVDNGYKKSYKLAFLDWEQGEPNNGGQSPESNESCAELKANGRFNDVSCDTKKRVVCKNANGWFMTPNRFTWEAAPKACRDANAVFTRPDSVSDQRQLIEMMNNDDHDRPWVNRRGGWIARHRTPFDTGWYNAYGGCTMGHFHYDDKPYLVVFNMDDSLPKNPENHGYYSMGAVNSDGSIESWKTTYQVPGWFGTNTAGAGITAGDVNGDGNDELFVFHIDDPKGENQGYYRMGWDINLKGNGKAVNWTDPINIPGEYGWWGEGGGIAMGDIDGNGRPDLVVFRIDTGINGDTSENSGNYRIGWNLNQNGMVTHWTGPFNVSGWFGDRNSGGGITMGDFTGSGRPNLIVYHIDNPDGGNQAYYRVSEDIGTDGLVTGWSAPTQIPGWFGTKSEGGGIAMGDIDGDNVGDLITYHIDDPDGANYGYFRVGLHKDKSRKINPFSIE